MNQVVFKISILKEGNEIHSFDLKSVDQLVGAFSILQTGMSLNVDCIQVTANKPEKGV